MRIHSQLNVYKSRLDHNIKLISEVSGNKKMIPMLKAEAYGHGVLGIIDFLEDYKSQVSYIGVASLAEAQYIKFSLSKKTFPIFVFSELGDLEENQSFYTDYGIYPVISSIADLKIYLGNNDLVKIPLVLKINTGMNRLGIPSNEVETVINLLKENDVSEINHLMSHYSSSYLADEKTSEQKNIFEKTLSEFKNSNISIDEFSIDNSGSLENDLSLNSATHIRPGLVLYGANSSFNSSKNLNTKIISDFETEIIKVIEVKAGETYGYGNTKIKFDGSLLILPLGYGDGISTGYSGLDFKIGEVSAQVFGRVNMDLTALFSKETSLSHFKGKKVKIWNENSLSINKISRHLKTHPYEVFCMLSSRLPRVYHLE